MKQLVYKKNDDYINYNTGRVYTESQVQDRQMIVLSSFDECDIVNECYTVHAWNCTCDNCLKYNELMKGL